MHHVNVLFWLLIAGQIVSFIALIGELVTKRISDLLYEK